MADELAFPTCIQVDTVSETKGGLTKREVFSAIILSGRLAHGNHDGSVVAEAVEYADQLLQILKHTGEKNGQREIRRRT